MAAKNIEPRTLARAFATFLAEEGIDPEKSLNAGLCAMIDFYSTVRADGCDLDADQDMLLFQWGAYDRGAGHRFEVDMVRQVMLPDEEDDDGIWQLHLTYRYPASAELVLFGSGKRWCPSPGEAAEFARFVLNAPPVAQASALGSARPKITFERAG